MLSKTQHLFHYPIGSMYAIYGNIYHPYTPNVGIYTIHGSYGYGGDPFLWRDREKKCWVLRDLASSLRCLRYRRKLPKSSIDGHTRWSGWDFKPIWCNYTDDLQKLGQHPYTYDYLFICVYKYTYIYGMYIYNILCINMYVYTHTNT